MVWVRGVCQSSITTCILGFETVSIQSPSDSTWSINDSASAVLPRRTCWRVQTHYVPVGNFVRESYGQVREKGIRISPKHVVTYRRSEPPTRVGRPGGAAVAGPARACGDEPRRLPYKARRSGKRLEVWARGKGWGRRTADDKGDLIAHGGPPTMRLPTEPGGGPRLRRWLACAP